MEEGKLNLNAPLLSVRRIATTPVSTSGDNGKTTRSSTPIRRHTLPPYKSEFCLEQVTEPVAVPFHWEHIPGRAKEGNEPEFHPPEEASVTPRLPPGKGIYFTKQLSEKDHADQNGIRPHFKAYSLHDNVMELKNSKEGINERGALELEDNDDVYSDAHETLSPTESFSLNCSATGLSQSDGADLKPSRAFTMDPQTRDFMMNRFLPAAKAMALETPQFATKKQYTTLEQPRQVTRLIREDMRPLLNEKGTHMELQYGQYKEEEESEGEDDEYDHSNYISEKGCGLFPRLCLRNSLCLLNPVPGMKVRTRALTSSSSGVVRPGKTTYSRSHSQPLKKGWDASYKQKSDHGSHSAELQKLKLGNKQGSESSRFTHSGDLKKGGSSPFRHSRNACISPFRNERPKSPFAGVGFLGVPKEDSVKANSKFNLHNKGGHSFQEVLSHQRNKQGSGSPNPTIEKTLYVDTVNTAKISCLNSCSLDTEGQVYSAGEDFETLLKRSGIEETSTAESLFQDIQCLNNLEGSGTLEPEPLESIGDNLSPLSEKSHFKGQVVAVEYSQVGLGQEIKSLNSSNSISNGNPDMKSDQIIKADQGNVDASSVQSPLPPPLPKSPSESWLWCTLSSISSRNSISQVHTKRLDSKTSSTSSKWETIVKTSNLHHDHVRYSEELITHIFKQSKS